MSIIIAETRQGSAFAHNAFVCVDEADFVGRIREVVARKGITESIETVEDAAAYLDECHAQSTQVITEVDFRGMERSDWGSAVEREAVRLGWLTEQYEEVPL